jgi:O-antigen ligase
MTIEADALPHQGGRARPRRAFSILIGSTAYLRCTDLLIELTAASLPWSTTAPAIFIGFWLILVIPTIEVDEFKDVLALPAAALPLALLGLAVIGTVWSGDPWPERLHGISPVLKLALIPFLLHYFLRSQRGPWVFVAFLASSALLMILSWIVLVEPNWKVTATASVGVPVKNYIDQSQEFALCAFALAWPALMSFRRRQFSTAIYCLIGILAFVANMMFVVSARTALIYMPVLLLVFAFLHLDRRTAVALCAAVTVAGLVVWTTSPYLRSRVADISVEYQAHDLSTPASTAQRLNYWRKSIKFIAEAPWFGHGTGSIQGLFQRDAVGKSGLQAEVVNNPHNQSLNAALQWGLLGTLILYAMWLSHLLLFAGDGEAEWIGLAVVVQNFVSSLLNSHLFDFHEGWMYVLGVGVAGGMMLARRRRRRERSMARVVTDLAADDRAEQIP